MGSCGSSLNCNECFSRYHFKGCKNEIDINPDIAGVGVLTSFYLSAVGVSIVVIWGYVTQTLPQYVYGSTDIYTLLLLKKRRRTFDGADLDFRQSKEQLKKARIITNFIKVLSNQQAITGVAILIAALANRCRISMYEFNIVVSLAFFAIFTHTLSLTVLRHYYYHHKTVRAYQVIISAVLLILFVFSFIINTSVYNFEDIKQSETLNVGNVLQCIFEPKKFGKIVQFDYSVDTILFLVLVTFLYGMALGDLFLEPPKHYLEPINDTINKFYYFSMRRFLSKSGLSDIERHEVIINSELKYWAWLQPTTAVAHSTNISIWYLIESYIASYIVIIPGIFLGITYGTGSTSIAVWFGRDGLQPTSGLQILGFGQIVAIGLLALVFLAATEIINEQNVIERGMTTSDVPESVPLQDLINEASNSQTEDSYGSSRLDIVSTAEIEHPDGRGSPSGQSAQLPRKQDQRANRQNQSPSNESNVPFLKRYDGFLEFLVRIGVKKTKEDLEAIKKG